MQAGCRPRTRAWVKAEGLGVGLGAGLGAGWVQALGSASAWVQAEGLDSSGSSSSVFQLCLELEKYLAPCRSDSSSSDSGAGTWLEAGLSSKLRAGLDSGSELAVVRLQGSSPP